MAANINYLFFKTPEDHFFSIYKKFVLISTDFKESPHFSFYTLNFALSQLPRPLFDKSLPATPAFSSLVQG